MSKNGTRYLPYEVAVLHVLDAAVSPLMLLEIYHRVGIYKSGDAKTLFPSKEESDPEYEIRWALSSLGKLERGLVKNSADSADKVWEITEARKAYFLGQCFVRQ
jgi:hypothetical protein